MDLLTNAVLGVLGSAVVELAVKHWRDVFKWVKDIFNGIKDVFGRFGKGIYYALKAYVELLSSKVASFRNRLLYRENHEFIEEIRERRVQVDTLPDWARRNAVIGQNELRLVL